MISQETQMLHCKNCILMLGLNALSERSCTRHTSFKLMISPRRTEAVFLFRRRPQATNPLIHFGYCDLGHDALQGGERLYVSLKKDSSSTLRKTRTRFPDHKGHFSSLNQPRGSARPSRDRRMSIRRPCNLLRYGFSRALFPPRQIRKYL